MRTPGLSNGLGPFTYLSLPWLIPCEFHETGDPPSPGTHVPGKNLHSPRSTGEGPVFQATRGPALPVPGGSSPVPHVPNRIGLLQVKPHRMPSAKRPCAHLSSMDPATTQGTNSAPGAGHAEMGLSKPTSAPEGNDNVVSASGARRGPNSGWTDQGRLPREARRKRQGGGNAVRGRRRDKSRDPGVLGAAARGGRPALAARQRPEVLRRALPPTPPSRTPSTPRAQNQNYSHAASDICSNQFVIIRK